ncbi:MAG: nickel pincer cofactor biosynthesis protein LarC [Caldisericia bacterium]|nr:nickel pincer cofactor biosynthesis protein LarC [Caldisericia bacterium]
MIKKYKYLKEVKNLSKNIKLTENEKFEEVHLHELGGLDSIIDIVGSVIGLRLLNVEKVYSSPVPVGSGFVKTHHGVLPIPAPATIEILKGVPIFSNGIKGEITTPTGAAIITTLSTSFGDLPSMKIEKIGYGLGKKDFEIPNILRVFIGELYDFYLKDFNTLIETNIDDMNPQIFGYIIDKAFSLGALDVFFTPIYMKKNRPSYKISILCEEKDKNNLIDLIFSETTSIGVRLTRVEKVFLKREIKELETELGKIRIKISYFKGEKKITPEYDDIKKIAEEKNLPIVKIYSIIEKELNKINL